MSKVLFFDVDGTLINYHGDMPASTKTALKLARQNGHQIVICSGRARYQLSEELLNLCDGLIGTTGANVEYQGKKIYEHFLSFADMQRIEYVLKSAKAKVAWMSEKRMYMNEDCQKYLCNKFSPALGKDRVKEIMGDTMIINQLSEYEDIKKVLYYDSEWSVEQVEQELKDCCDVTSSSFEKEESDSGEITCKGINKSLGMKKYIEFQSMKKEDTIAFGDGPNDVDMIQYAQVGVVMGNGREDLKKIADVVTESVDDDGIYYAMKMLNLI